MHQVHRQIARALTLANAFMPLPPLVSKGGVVNAFRHHFFSSVCALADASRMRDDQSFELLALLRL